MSLSRQQWQELVGTINEMAVRLVVAELEIAQLRAATEARTETKPESPEYDSGQYL